MRKNLLQENEQDNKTQEINNPNRIMKMIQQKLSDLIIFLEVITKEDIRLSNIINV